MKRTILATSLMLSTFIALALITVALAVLLIMIKIGDPQSVTQVLNLIIIVTFEIMLPGFVEWSNHVTGESTSLSSFGFGVYMQVLLLLILTHFIFKPIIKPFSDWFVARSPLGKNENG